MKTFYGSHEYVFLYTTICHSPSALPLRVDTWTLKEKVWSSSTSKVIAKFLTPYVTV